MAIPTDGDDLADFQQFVASGAHTEQGLMPHNMDEDHTSDGVCIA
jgi:hypothetical protein